MKHMTDQRYREIKTAVLAATRNDLANDNRPLLEKFAEFAPTPGADAYLASLSPTERAEYSLRMSQEPIGAY